MAFRSAKFVVTSGGSLGTLAGFVGDFLLPVAKVGEIFLVLCLFVALLSLSLRFAIPPLNSRLSRSFENWCFPFVAATLFFGSVAYGAQLLSKHYGDDGNGVMAAALPQVKELQHAVGILKSIDARVGEMVVAQREGNVLAAKGNILAEEGNAQRELTNKGVFWNMATLQDALIRGDIDTLEIFRKAGHDLGQVNVASSAAPLSEPMILYAVRQNHSTIDKVLEYLVRYHYLDLGRTYTTPMANAKISVLWQKQEVDKRAQRATKEGVSFASFRRQMEKEGYVIPAKMASDYHPFPTGFIAGPAYTKTTLLIEAICADNIKAVAYLKRHKQSATGGYIQLTNDVKIVVSPELVAQASDVVAIRKLF